MTKNKKRRRRARNRRLLPQTPIQLDLTIDEVMADLTYGWTERPVANLRRADGAGGRAA